MPRLVHSLKFTDHSKEKTVNRERSTVNRKSIGFTLIELLVVIVIIGIIGSIGFYAYQSSQQKARDGRRKSDLTQVKKAMEAVKNDCLAGTFYPKPLTISETGRYQDLDEYLADPDLKYENSSINDLSTDVTYHYKLTLGLKVANVCPDLSGVPNIFPGSKLFVIRAMLENTADPDTDKSYNDCSSTITAIGTENFNMPTPGIGDGHYYVCND